MDTSVPKDFVEVERDHFFELFAVLDWRRVAYGSGEEYSVRGRRCGYHCERTERFFVDPTYFKKKEQS